MGVLFTLAFVVVAIAWPTRLAFRGEGYRGLYFGAALCCFVLTIGCFNVIPDSRDLARAVASKDDSQVEGTKLLMTAGPAIAFVWIAATFGTFLGGVIFRAKTAPMMRSPASEATPPNRSQSPPRVEDLSADFEEFQAAVKTASIQPRSFVDLNEEDDDTVDDDETAEEEEEGLEEQRLALPTDLVGVQLLPCTSRGFFLEVTGESFYSDHLYALFQTHGRKPFHVRLVAEPNNQYDKNAVCVRSMEGSTLGYLTRGDAPRYQQSVLALAQRNVVACCHARLAGGDSERPNIGIWLDVEAPTIVAHRLGLKYQRVRS